MEDQKKIQPQDRRNTAIGIFWAAVSVVCWGTLFPAVSILVRRGNMDCYSMAQFRFILAGAVMLVIQTLITRKGPWCGIEGKDWIRLVMQSIFAGAMSVLLFFGQSLGLPVVNAALLEAEAPLMIFLLGLIILREKTSFLQMAGLFFGFLGSMFVLKVIQSKGLMISSLTLGDGMVALGALCWALYTVLAHRTIRKIGGVLYTAWSLLFAGLWILLFQRAAGLDVHLPHLAPDVLCSAYLGLIPTAMAFFAWNNAQRYISTGLLAVSGYFTPMLTALFGWLLFREPISLFQFSGVWMVILSALVEPEISGLLQNLIRRKKKSD